MPFIDDKESRSSTRSTNDETSTSWPDLGGTKAGATPTGDSTTNTQDTNTGGGLPKK